MDDLLLATTWSVPNPTKHITGNQIETILEITSRDEMARNTAMHTSQLPIFQSVHASFVWHEWELTENCLQENLMPFWSDSFRFRESKSFILVCTSFKSSTIYCISVSAISMLISQKDLQPVRTAMKNNAPARFPKKLTNQVFNKSRKLHLLCNHATTLYMQ